MLRRLMAAALVATGLVAAPVPAAHAAPAKPPSCDPGYCFTVDVKLDRAPAVGQTATLTVEVTAKEDLPDATTVIELPETLRWVRPPAGLDRGAATIGRSPVDRASRTERARRGKAVRYEGVVAAVAPGPASIRVQARDGRPGPGSEGLAYLTIGERSSIFGMPRDLPVREARMPAAAKSLAGDTCVQGRVKHVQSEDGTVRGVPRTLVEAWDTDAKGPDNLGWTLTDGAGDYKICFPGVDQDGGAQDVYIQVSSINNEWDVVNPATGDSYSGVSEVTWDVPAGTLTTIDYESGRGSPLEGGFRVFTSAYETWKAYTGWLGVPGNECWKPGEVNCQSVRILWAPDTAGGSYYCPYAGGAECPNRFELHLGAPAQLRKMTVAHELGHFIMDYTYNGMPPIGPLCQDHWAQKITTPGCAWTEGWADWVAIQVYGDTHYRWGTDGAIDLESPRWFTEGWPSGSGTDAVEGRVAGVLIDLGDSGTRNEKYWDTSSLGPAGMVTAFRKAPADDIHQFLGQLEARDRPAADEVLFHNTVLPGYSEILNDRTAAYRPANLPYTQDFRTTAGSWSVVATATSGAGGADVDMRVTPAGAPNDAVTSSEWGSSGPDFVAVQPTPQDELFSVAVTSDTDYQEFVTEAAKAPDGDLEKGTPMEFGMGADRLVEIRTTWIEKGVPSTINVLPRNGQDLDLFVMAPDAGRWGLPRSAARRSASGGPNKAERITIADPKVTGVYAVIVIRKSGEGNVLLTHT
ncbi:hypothetical protein AAH991_14480 [Microbispora sp. ZYX-F-249]|uniref:Carboxypeptidase regulatory-like domain-containing protein n=1 Tax=Microbispora maris TaxID=3144104 RepID=A0ABV0AM00_9ACTN